MKSKQNRVEKLSRYTSSKESPGYQLWQVSMRWRSLIEKTLKPMDLTHPQFVVLATTGWLTRHGDTISQVEISKAASLDPNTISQILRSLEAKKLITRKHSLNEKSKSPLLTQFGFEKLSQALPAVEEADAAFFDRLNKQETEEFLDIVQKLIIENRRQS